MFRLQSGWNTEQFTVGFLLKKDFALSAIEDLGFVDLTDNEDLTEDVSDKSAAEVTSN